jgi:aldose sugar dehydrogenase
VDHARRWLRSSSAETTIRKPFRESKSAHARIDETSRETARRLRNRVCCALHARGGFEMTSGKRLSAVIAACALAGAHTIADTTPLRILDPTLQVTTVLNSGVTQPIGIVFLTANDYLVLEKASGQVKRVVNGVIQAAPVLDLAVNSASERGLLAMALHPNFPATPQVFVRWTESSTGADTNVTANVPLLGNRVDRFLWNGSTLTFDTNILMARALQTDNVQVPGQPPTTVNPGLNGNHNGGPIVFGPDGKLYVFLGDQGRRGWMQNLPNGPFENAPFVDDTFGGPAPDDAHLSGVVLRLNPDGSAPADNPFYSVGAALTGAVGANIQKVFSYGHRNGFGMAFDPYGTDLWVTENGDDSFSELNRVEAGSNGGWIQIMGPQHRFADYKAIEVNEFGGALQQVRFPPSRLAHSPGNARGALFMLPGATYIDPELSWKYESGPAGTAFVRGTALGDDNEGTLWFGSSRSFQQVGGTGGSIYRVRLSRNRKKVDVSDPALAERVVDNLTKWDPTETESLVIGTGFGTTPDIQQGPDGNLYVVSITDGAIYKISRQ